MTIIIVDQSGKGDVKTLNEANSRAKDGDTIIVGGGTYHEALKITVPRTIWLALDPTNRPVLDGNYSPGERLPNGDMPRYNAKKSYLPGSLYGKMLSLAAPGVEVSGFIIENVAGQCVGLEADGVQLIDCGLHHAYGGALNAEDVSDVLVSDCIITQNDQKRYDPDNTTGGPANVQVNVLFKTVTRGVIRNCHIFENHGEGVGISLESQDCLVAQNSIFTNLHMQIVVNHAQNNVFDGNYIFHSNDLEFRQRKSGDPPSGIMISDELGRDEQGWKVSRGNVFTNNVVWGCDINFNSRVSKNSIGALRDTIISHNTFVNARVNNPASIPFGIRIPPGEHENSRFENNIVVQDRGTIIKAPGGKGVDFRYNLWLKEPEKEAKGEGDQVGDPKLDDVFAPTPLSDLVIGKGVAFEGEPATVKVDAFGNSRERGSDLGAIQYTLEPPLPPDEEPSPPDLAGAIANLRALAKRTEEVGGLLEGIEMAIIEAAESIEALTDG